MANNTYPGTVNVFIFTTVYSVLVLSNQSQKNTTCQSLVRGQALKIHTSELVHQPLLSSSKNVDIVYQELSSSLAERSKREHQSNLLRR